MGFLKKLLKHAVKDAKRDVGIAKKVTMRPIRDAKKAVGFGNKLSGKAGGPKIPTRISGNPKMAMQDAGLGRGPLKGPLRGGGARPKSPPIRAGGPAPKTGGSAPRMGGTAPRPGIAPRGIRGLRPR